MKSQSSSSSPTSRASPPSWTTSTKKIKEIIKMASAHQYVEQLSSAISLLQISKQMKRKRRYMEHFRNRKMWHLPKLPIEKEIKPAATRSTQWVQNSSRCNRTSSTTETRHKCKCKSATNSLSVLSHLSLEECPRIWTILVLFPIHSTWRTSHTILSQTTTKISLTAREILKINRSWLLRWTLMPSCKTMAMTGMPAPQTSDILDASRTPYWVHPLLASTSTSSTAGWRAQWHR